MTPEQLNDMRKRVLNGEPYTKEEFSGAIRTMLAERIKVTAAPTKKAASTKKTLTDLDDLMG